MKDLDYCLLAIIVFQVIVFLARLSRYGEFSEVPTIFNQIINPLKLAGLLTLIILWRVYG